MYHSGMNSPKNKNSSYLIISEKKFDDFQHNLSEEKIKNLYSLLKQYEKKGYVSYQKYFLSMKNIFDKDLSKKENQNIFDSNSSSYSLENEINVKNNNYFHEIYDLIFKRFREIKCIIKNNKNIFYLTDFRKENYISSYHLVCALTIFLKESFDHKIKLLFHLSDDDEDGYLNKEEIKNMISTINQLFGEEISTIKISSSIVSQSLTNIKVSNILYELLYGIGNLYNILKKEQNFINFDMFYESIKKIKNYKYIIIPCFINFRKSLFFHRKEKMINVKQKHKKDFINISSSLILEQKEQITQLIHKKFSLSNLDQIVTPIKINKNNSVHKENKYKKLKLNFSSDKNIKKLKSNFLKSDKSLKNLIKCSTIFDENEKNKSNKIIKINSYNNKKKLNNNKSNFSQYAFQANLIDIKNIEVEPGVIKFLPNDIENDEENKANIKKFILPHKKSNGQINNNLIGYKNKEIKILDTLHEFEENNISEKKRSLKRHNTGGRYLKNNKLKKFNNLFSISTKNLKIYSNFNSGIKQNNLTNLKNKKKHIFKNNYSNEKYKTLDEILGEIKLQEKNFDFDSAGHLNNEMIKDFKETQLNMTKIKKRFKFIKEKENNSMNFLKLFGKKDKKLVTIKPYTSKS